MKNYHSLLILILFFNIRSSQLSILDKQRAQKLNCISALHNQTNNLTTIGFRVIQSLNRSKNPDTDIESYIELLNKRDTRTGEVIFTSDIDYAIFKNFILQPTSRVPFFTILIRDYKKTDLIIEHLNKIKKECELILNVPEISAAEKSKYEEIKYFTDKKLKELMPQVPSDILQNNPPPANAETYEPISTDSSTVIHHPQPQKANNFNLTQSVESLNQINAETLLQQEQETSLIQIIESRLKQTKYPRDKINIIEDAINRYKSSLSVQETAYLRQRLLILKSMHIKPVPGTLRRTHARRELVKLTK